MLITVFGKRGSGKTTLIRRLIPVQKKPVIVVDVLGNYTDEPDWRVTHSHIEALNEIREYLRDPKKHPGIIVVADSDMSRTTDYICSALWKIEGGTLVLDEVDAISVPDAPCFDEAVRYGRNHGIDIITGCRRPAELSKNITAGADIAFCFNTQERRDVEYYAFFLGEEIACKLPNLPKHHGVFKDFGSNKTGVYKTLKDGKIVVLKEKQLKTDSLTQIGEKETIHETPIDETDESENDVDSVE